VTGDQVNGRKAGCDQHRSRPAGSEIRFVVDGRHRVKGAAAGAAGGQTASGARAGKTQLSGQKPSQARPWTPKKTELLAAQSEERATNCLLKKTPALHKGE
jgi:hypothetical protein